MHPLRRAFALFVLLLYVTLGTVGVRVVLCTGQGGHTAIEWLGADCCTTPDVEVSTASCSGAPDAPDQHAACTDEASASRPYDAPPTEDCGDCEDVTVARLLASRTVNVDPDVGPVPPIAWGIAADDPSAIVCSAAPRCARAPDWVPPPAPDPVRTRTVLRL